jgi:hypothetical protein
MAQTSPPGPQGRSDDGHADRDPLSPWERQVLDRIEGDLTDSDPDFARRMAHRVDLGTVAPTLALRWLVLLVGALIVVVVAATLLPASGWAVLGLITTVMVLPWMLLCASATAARREDRDD